ncbi:MAG TPA: WG repeat-containing protein [Bryobacteraceae bacterium]|jgi:hypothetical protein|nr:WG repeat-containing protein [Bryobacteraceae bacterium]
MNASVVITVAGLLASSCAHRDRTVDCHAFPDGKSLTCLQASDGSVVIAKQALAGLDFEGAVTGAIVVGKDQLYFVNRRGKTAPALRFDNGADYFVEGLARSVKAGKIGFVNPNLDEVIAPRWDFASPFQDGLAAVCNGCAPKSDRREHTVITGGKWGYIDKLGKVVVPVVYDEANLPPRASVVHH